MAKCIPEFHSASIYTRDVVYKALLNETLHYYRLVN